MPFEIRYSREAVDDLRQCRASERAELLNQMRELLTVNPELESKARVKKLRQPAPAQYRLRVGEFRVFYDVIDDHVDVLRVLSKAEATRYLEAR